MTVLNTSIRRKFRILVQNYNEMVESFFQLPVRQYWGIERVSKPFDDDAVCKSQIAARPQQNLAATGDCQELFHHRF
jgi:hypothetical protein